MNNDAFIIQKQQNTIDALSLDLNNARRELTSHRQKAQGNYWAWQGDGEDHLESLSYMCPVVISAESLKKIIDERDNIIEKLCKALDAWGPSPVDRFLVDEARNLVARMKP